MGTIPLSPLGKATLYPERYDAGLLYPVERAPQRFALGIVDPLPFAGRDRWTAWEVFWLDAGGRPRAGIASFDVPCTSPCIVESKSVKLWLVSMNAERLGTPGEVAILMERELSAATGSTVEVRLDAPAHWSRHQRTGSRGRSIDDELVGTLPDAPDPALLRVDAAGEPARETLVSHGFRSVCPVTGQPDYATILVDYAGSRIDAAVLLRYLTGYRHHPGFHEACAEQIFVDITRACSPASLTVEARFARRGGIDINPLRSSAPSAPEGSRPTLRQ